MLWTLWRSISVEFWRLLLLTTAVLVATIAFAITIKPLADGKLSPDQALRFMFYAIPPMLAYATPFAAGFAATIAIHRMSSENEVTAVYASGVSHKKFLVPSLVAGLILGGAIYGLNDQVIPRFLKEMERMVTQDFAKIFVGSLQSGESARIGNNEIHADKVQRSSKPTSRVWSRSMAPPSGRGSRSDPCGRSTQKIRRGSATTTPRRC